MNNEEWLQSLKPGDAVIVSATLQKDTIGRVERVTASQIILGRDRRYKKANGLLIGAGKWHIGTIEPPTPERVAAIYRRQMIADLKAFKYELLNDDALKQIKAIIKAPESKVSAEAKP